MNKLKVLGASLAMALLVASPAAADTAQAGGFSAEGEFLFFDDDFGNDNFGNGFFD